MESTIEEESAMKLPVCSVQLSVAEALNRLVEPMAASIAADEV